MRYVLMTLGGLVVANVILVAILLAADYVRRNWTVPREDR